jgi:MFS family permease
MTVTGAPSTTSPTRANLEIVAVGLGALMAALSQTLVLPVLPTIASDIGASTTEAQWLLTSTLLVAAISVPILGRVADIFGRRLVLVLSLVALGIGSLVAALTSNPEVMIAGRAISGLSAAAIPLGISLLASVLPAERKASATALISAMLGVGGALGLPLAGLIADNADYHVLFWVGAVGAFLSIAMVLSLVGEPGTSGTRTIDVPGIVLLAGGLLCLVLPLSQGGTWGWGSVRVIGLLVASVVLLGLLVLVERRTASPLVDLTALANPPVAMTNIASVFFGFALFASFVGTANYVQAPEATGYGFGSSVLTAGLCLLPSGILMLLLAPVAARLCVSIGGGNVLAISGVIVAAGLLVRIGLVDHLWQIVLGASIVGAGTGIGYATLPTLINSHTPPDALAAANGINTLARSLGSTLASAVGGSILASLTMSLGVVEVPSLAAYRVLFVICAVSAVTASIFGLVIARRGEPAVTSAVPVTP